MIQKQKFRHNKTAIHPASAAILLITLLVAAAAIIYVFITMQTRAGNTIQIQSITTQPPNTIIYVQNTGQAPVTIKTVQINTDQYAITSANCTVQSENTTTIQQGSTAQITINQQYTDTVHVKVTCTDGTSYETDYKP